MRIFVVLNVALSFVIFLVYFIFNQSWYAEMLLSGLWHLCLLFTVSSLATIWFSKHRLRFSSLVAPLLLIVCFVDANVAQWRKPFLSTKHYKELADTKAEYRLITIAQHNTSNWSAETDRIIGWIHSIAKQTDIIFLIEVNKDFRQILRDKFIEDFPHRIIDPNPNKRGQVLFSKLPIQEYQFIESVDPHRDPDLLAVLSPPMQTDGKYNEQWLFVGIHPHAPVSQRWFDLRNQGYEKYTKLIQHWPDKPLIIAGDFNATQYNYWFRKIRRDFDLTFRTNLLGTAPSFVPKISAITIDHLLHSKHWRTVDRQVGEFYGGAHSTVVTRLAWHHSTIVTTLAWQH